MIVLTDAALSTLAMSEAYMPAPEFLVMSSFISEFIIHLHFFDTRHFRGAIFSFVNHSKQISEQTAKYNENTQEFEQPNGGVGNTDVVKSNKDIVILYKVTTSPTEDVTPK